MAAADFSAAAIAFKNMQHPKSLKLVAVLCFAAFLIAVKAEPQTSTDGITARIENAQSEKRIEQRLQALATVANDLKLAEIPNALKAADELKSLREQLAFRDSVLKRWGALAPANAFAHISQMA